MSETVGDDGLVELELELDEETIATIHRMAEAEGVSTDEIVARCLRWFIDNHEELASAGDQDGAE